MMLTITPGSSWAAIEDIPSCLSDIPGLEDEVMTRAPAALAPAIILIAASSLSDWMNMPPGTFRRFSAMYSGISFCGVMG
jgi:hypothetical protein